MWTSQHWVLQCVGIQGSQSVMDTPWYYMYLYMCGIQCKVLCNINRREARFHMVLYGMVIIQAVGIYLCCNTKSQLKNDNYWKLPFCLLWFCYVEWSGNMYMECLLNIKQEKKLHLYHFLYMNLLRVISSECSIFTDYNIHYIFLWQLWYYLK